VGKNSILNKFPIIIIESTFIDKPTDKKTIKKRQEKKHISWHELEPYIKSLPNVKFLLIHFSSIYSEDTLLEFFKDKMSIYPNIIPFI